VPRSTQLRADRHDELPPRARGLEARYVGHGLQVTDADGAWPVALSDGFPIRPEDQSPDQASILRRLDLLGLRRTRRESRRRAKLRVKRPLHHRAGRPLSLRHRHQTPQPSSRNHTSSHARRKTNFPQLEPAASISATHSAPTATATPPGGIRRYTGAGPKKGEWPDERTERGQL
jgi:hypothetical protein